MCDSVFLKKENIEVFTISELLKYCPKGLLTKDNNITRKQENFCLCSINLEMTAKLNGYVFIEDDGDYIFETRIKTDFE